MATNQLAGRRGVGHPEREPRTALGARVRQLRHARGWTQAELAHAAGLSPSAVEHLEIGDREPRWTTLVRIAIALDMVPADLALSVVDSVSA